MTFKHAFTLNAAIIGMSRSWFEDQEQENRLKPLTLQLWECSDFIPWSESARRSTLTPPDFGSGPNDKTGVDQASQPLKAKENAVHSNSEDGGSTGGVPVERHGCVCRKRVGAGSAACRQ
ncbi:MAG: hypothetical protein WDN30_05025 [Pararobbsia sp.]